MIPIQSIIDITTLGLVVVIILILLPYMYKQNVKMANLHTAVEKINKQKNVETNDSLNNDTKESDDESTSPPTGSPGGKDQSDDETEPTYTDVSDSDIF